MPLDCVARGGRPAQLLLSQRLIEAVVAGRDSARPWPVPNPQPPAWHGAANAAAVRLAAEAGGDVDDILEHPAETSRRRLVAQIARLENSAEAPEVAADLAGLLWAECEDVPPIAVLLEEPATRAALEAVSEARRLAAERLSAARTDLEGVGPDPAPRAGVDDAFAPAAVAETPHPQWPPEVPVPPEQGPAQAPGPALSPKTAAPAAASGHRPARGATVAGAAAALLLFGRRLRRA